MWRKFVLFISFIKFIVTIFTYSSRSLKLYNSFRMRGWNLLDQKVTFIRKIRDLKFRFLFATVTKNMYSFSLTTKTLKKLPVITFVPLFISYLKSFVTRTQKDGCLFRTFLKGHCCNKEKCKHICQCRMCCALITYS